MEVIIRKAQLCDIPEIYEMNNTLNDEVGSTIEYMKKSLESNNEIVLVAVRDKKAIGFICGQIYSSICCSKG